MNHSTVGHSLDVALPCPACGDIDGCHHPEANPRRIENERPIAGLVALVLAVAATVGVIVLVLG